MRTDQWLYWARVLDSKWCDDFVEYATKTYTPQEATIGFENNRADSDYRECEIRWMNTQREESLVKTIWNYAQEASRNSFDVDIRYINELQFTTYRGSKKKPGKYGWHHDVDFKNYAPYHRKLSFTLQLSDPKDYEGGEFEFDPDIDPLPEEAKQKGTVLVFPSFYKHQVKPVTKGTRHSLVTWVEGPHWR